MRILGVDHGSKRIGLALSDETAMLAQPIGYIIGSAADVARIAQERGAARIVVGLPRRLDGTDSPQTEQTLRFIAALEKAAGLPVVKWDERLTTAQVERLLIEGDVRRSARREKRDTLAAVVMLQSYLDAQNQTFSPDETP